MVMGTSTLREAPLVSFSYRPKMSVHILSVVFRSIHDSVGEFNFRRDVLFSQAAKVVDIPTERRKFTFFVVSFLTF